MTENIKSKYAYRISTSFYDTEQQCFYCKVGIPTNKGIELHYTVWDSGAMLCQEKAIRLVKLLTPLKEQRKSFLEKIFGKSNYGQ